jgi:O-antigen/teichoic acid export membrane protein
VIENVARLLVALVLVANGAGVTGAYLGTVIAVVGSAAALALVLRRLGPGGAHAAAHSLRELTRDAAVPIIALTLLAALQNADVVMAKHALSATAAGVYAAVTVAGKATVWVAIGLGLWVLPEATRQAAEGRDPRPVLLKALLVVGVVAGVALSAYGAAPRLVLRLAFGPGYETVAPILFMLGVAYALLAVSYLAVQSLLGLHRRRFTLVLAAAAAALPMWLSGYDTVSGFALAVLLVQTASAGTLSLLCLSTRYGREARAPQRPPRVAAAEA